MWRMSNADGAVLRAVIMGWCLGTAGCSCGATVLDYGRRHDDAGTVRGSGGGKDSDRAGRLANDAATKPDAYSPDTGVRSKSGSQITVLGVRSGDAETGAADPALRDEKHGIVCSTKL